MVGRIRTHDRSRRAVMVPTNPSTLMTVNADNLGAAALCAAATTPRVGVPRMADQYWVLPISGLELGQRVSGVPVTQLPDTSGMVEILVNATVVRTCQPSDPVSGEDQRCYTEDASVEVYVMPSGGSAESYIDNAFIADIGVEDGAAFNAARVVIDTDYKWMGFPYLSPVIVPPAGRLYVAFESPATAGELRTVSAGAMGDWALRLDVDTHNPENLSAPVNFRMFMASGAQPGFWAAFVNSAEIV